MVPYTNELYDLRCSVFACKSSRSLTVLGPKFAHEFFFQVLYNLTDQQHFFGYCFLIACRKESGYVDVITQRWDKDVEKTEGSGRAKGVTVEREPVDIVYADNPSTDNSLVLVRLSTVWQRSGGGGGRPLPADGRAS